MASKWETKEKLDAGAMPLTDLNSCLIPISILYPSFLLFMIDYYKIQSKVKISPLFCSLFIKIMNESYEHSTEMK